MNKLVTNLLQATKHSSKLVSSKSALNEQQLCQRIEVHKMKRSPSNVRGCFHMGMKEWKKDKNTSPTGGPRTAHRFGTEIFHFPPHIEKVRVTAMFPSHNYDMSKESLTQDYNTFI